MLGQEIEDDKWNYWLKFDPFLGSKNIFCVHVGKVDDGDWIFVSCLIPESSELREKIARRRMDGHGERSIYVGESRDSNMWKMERKAIKEIKTWQEYE